MAAPSAEQLLAVAVQAAAAASEAAQALKDFAKQNDQSGKQKFNEASKIIKQPDHFGSEDIDLDQRTWRDFLLNFKSWLFYADSKFETELKFVEEHPKVVIELSKLNGEEQSRALQLYSIFTGILRGKPLRLLRQQEDRNGLEVYRQLLQQFQPSSKSRALSLLQAYMQAPMFVKEKTLHEQVLGLERLRSEYQKCSGEDVSDDLALSILVKCLPNHIRQHIQLQMSDSSTYASVRSYVMSYEVVTASWSTSKVHTELGVVGSYASPGNSGPSPMEIDAVTWKGKGKSKGKDGKGKSKGKGKDGKGKGGSPWSAKGKGKSKDFSKGKSDGSGKGSYQSGYQKLDPNQCAYCFKFGHRKADCRKMQSDKAAGGVRQVHETNGDSVDDSSNAVSSNTGASSSNAPASQPSVQNIRAVSNVGPHVPFVQDLTAFEQYSCEHPISFSRICAVQHHDMSCTDDDDSWTYSPFLPASSDIQCICAIPSHDRGGHIVEILLDSGADSSVLPLECASLGHAVQTDPSSRFVDAQGAPIHQRGRRVAEVCLGTDVIIKEQFMVASVTGPIICLGRLLRSGWDFKRVNGELHLCKDGYSFSTYYRKNSLYTQGVISKIANISEASGEPEAQSVNAIRLTSLANLAPGWNEFNQDLWAMETSSPTCVDTALCPSRTLLWLRTVLVEYQNTGWEVIEYSQPLEEISDMEYTVPNRENVIRMITIAHNYAVPCEFLGFEMDEVAMPSSPMVDLGISPDGNDEDEDFLSYPVPAVPPEGIVEPPRAGNDEPDPDDRVVAAPTDGSVMVEGVKIDISCPLKVIRTACDTLGLSTRGSKKINLQRLQNFVKTQELMAAHSVETQVRSESKREIHVQKRPVEPTKQQVEKHNLTHEPFEEWCELCVSFRARQDKHVATDDSRSSSSLVSFDFGFCGRSAEESTDKATFLAMHDKDTGLIGAAPTLSKGGKCFQYLVSELTRFIVSTGHESVRLRCDEEPSTIALLQAVCKSCRSLGIKVTPEPTAVGNHQANGGAERAVELVRSHACILISHLESCCNTGKQIFSCTHPLFSWALAHAAWIHNRFRVSFGQTAFERATGRCYNGRLAQFGERVFGFIRQDRKGDPKWLPAIWLGKTLSNDVHLLAHEGVIFVSRSIRRVRDNFQLEMLGTIEVGPWDHGMASLGHRLFQSRRYAGPDPIPALNYEEHGEQARPEEAEASASREQEQGEEGETGASKAPSAVSMSRPLKSKGVSFAQPPPDDPFRYGASKPPPVGISAKAGTVEEGVPNPSLNTGPPSPRGNVARDEVDLEGSSRPSKQAKVDQPDQVMSVRDQHEDEELEFSFQDDEIDMLEGYDNTIDYEDYDLESSTCSNSEFDKLIFEFTPHEPNLTDQELKVLDDVADRVEIQRLRDMQVLLASEVSELGVVPKNLSTRFVRTWREKVIDNKHCWLRRSRLVAREYAWLSERTDLFSPASNALGGRLLQTLYLRMRHAGYILASVDIGDAFLTVPQKEFTVVSLTSACGEVMQYQLGRVLPGQRTGSQLWYEAITSLLCKEADMVQCPESPNLLRSVDSSCYILLHVDDMLICGKSDFVDGKLIPMLKTHHKVSSSFLRQEGDEISFLKRTHRLISNGMLTISTHHKHIEQLMQITGVKPTSRPKKVPGHPLLDEKDDTEALNPDEASHYRSCVGILLYLATDLPHCQHTIRWLSTGMATPTVRKKDVLRHLVSYLHGTKGLCLCLHYKGDNVGVHHQYYEDPDCLHLEVFSDSDWASNKSHRKSVSGGYICLGSCLMYSSSRTQKVISLSSGEAEVYAASSAACDSILLAKMVSFLTGVGVVVHHLLDSSAARGILSRQGVGRIRHLSCRVLWLQTLVKLRKDFSCDQHGKLIHTTRHLVSAVSGDLNLADLGTKRLAKKRLVELMCFCNLGFVENDIFTVIEDMQNIKSIQKISHIGSIITQLSLIQNALSRCNAETLNCSGSATSAMTFAMDIAGGYGEYFGGILFMTVEVQIWQLMLVFCMMTCIGVWVIYEIRGYKASLASWSALTDDLQQDEWNDKRDAFISYMRWKRQQEERSSWVPMTIRSWFSGDRGDIDRAPGSGECSSFSQSTSTQTALLDTVELPPIRRYAEDEPVETESEKATRYLHQRLDESSDVELWMSIHHHEDMDVDGEGEDLNAPPHPCPEMHDLQRSRTRAIRVYERLRQEAVDRNDLDELDALERRYEWLYYV